MRIYELRQSGLSKAKIGKALGRPTCTITRELYRNKDTRGHYLPDTAQQKALARNRRGKRLEKNEDLRAYVIDHLCSFGWTPEQIAGALKTREPALGYVCHESIYAWIYSHGSKKIKLWKHLKRHKAKRGLRKSRGSGVSRIPQRISIHERSAVINSRNEFGHWEGDLMSFLKNSQHMLVLRERKSYYIVSRRLKRKTAEETSRSGLSLLQKLPEDAVKSMTLDNGGEFAAHTLWRDSLKINTYFCDPYASWQKGGIENSNGRLRHDLPRKTDIHSMTEEDFDEVIWNYNTTPRKTLGWKTPLEVFTEMLAAA